MATTHQHDAGHGGIMINIPKAAIPQPTAQFYESLSERQGAVSSLYRSPRRIPRPFPFVLSSRFLIWKQDPTVTDLGYRTM